jgi:hypothetical protein
MRTPCLHAGCPRGEDYGGETTCHRYRLAAIGRVTRERENGEKTSMETAHYLLSTELSANLKGSWGCIKGKLNQAGSEDASLIQWLAAFGSMQL